MAIGIEAGEVRWYIPATTYVWDSVLAQDVAQPATGVADSLGLDLIRKAVGSWNGTANIDIVQSTQADVEASAQSSIFSRNHGALTFTYGNTGTDLALFEYNHDAAGYPQYNIVLSQAADLSQASIFTAMQNAVAQTIGGVLQVQPIDGSSVLDSQLMELQQVHGNRPGYGAHILINDTMPGDAVASISLITDNRPTYYQGNSIAFLEGNLEYSATSDATTIARLYDSALGRGSDVLGLNFWLGKAQGGESLAEIGAQILGSTEGGLAGRWQGTDAVFIDDLYQQVLGRASDNGGALHWQQVLDGGAGRGAVLAEFMTSTEYLATAEAKLVFVADIDQMAIVRTMNAFKLWDEVSYKGFSEIAHDALQGGGSWAGIIGNAYAERAVDLGFAAGDDATFVSTLYQDVMGRVGEAEGLTHWESVLAGGASRADVVGSFVFSSELIEHQVQVMDAAKYDMWS